MKSNLTKLSPLTGQPRLHFWTVFGKATFMIFSQLLLAPCWAGNPKDSIPWVSYSPPNFPQTLAITDYRCQPFWGPAEGSLTSMPGSDLQDPSHHDSNAGSGQGEKRGVEDDPCRIPCHAPLRRWWDGQNRGRGKRGKEAEQGKSKRRKIKSLQQWLGMRGEGWGALKRGENM